MMIPLIGAFIGAVIALPVALQASESNRIVHREFMWRYYPDEKYLGGRKEFEAQKDIDIDAEVTAYMQSTYKD